MIKLIKRPLLLSLLILVLGSCGDNDDLPDVTIPDETRNGTDNGGDGEGNEQADGNGQIPDTTSFPPLLRPGVLVINEGNQGEANATLSFLRPDIGTVEDSVFSKANNGTRLGGIFHSMKVIGNKAYLVLNGNTVMKVNHDLKTQAILNQGLVNPRHFEIFQGEGIISCWGQLNESNQYKNPFIAIVDTSDLSLKRTIAFDAPPNYLLPLGKNLLVSHLSSQDSFLSLVSTTENKVIRMIRVSKGAGEMVRDKNGNAWVICSDSLHLLEPKNKMKKTSFSVKMAGSQLEINRAGDLLYYQADSSIYKMGITETSENKLFEYHSDVQTFYGLGVSPKGDVFIGDALSQSEGKVFQYDQSGSIIYSYETGLFPSSFVFISPHRED